jgi:hypothetical protein
MSKKPGLSLADIGEACEDVPVRDSFLRVYGLAAEDVLGLLNKYPEVLSKALKGAAKISDFVKAAPEVIGAIIAKASREEDEDAATEIARRIPLETQMNILEAVGRLTFTDGFGPFVKRVMALQSAAVRFASSGEATATNSRPVSKD